MNYQNILKEIRKKRFWIRLIILLFALFVLALNYNLFFLKNDLVVGGTSGLATLINHLYKVQPSIFILIFNIILIIFSFICLGKEQTTRTIIGSLLYPLFVHLTIPLAAFLAPYVQFNNFILIVLLSSMLFGASNGLIYKTGFTTGGIDILMMLIEKYYKIQRGKAAFFLNFVIVFTGGLVFGWEKVLYACIVVMINSYLVDKILIGISDSKMFFVYTQNVKDISNFILNEINASYTILTTEGGYTKEKRKMIMCVVPTRDYYYFKEMILQIDKDAFFVISDCYEVSGGVKRSNLPFI